MNATRQENSSRPESVLYMAMELGERKWQLAFGVGMAQKPRMREIAARDLAALAEEIRRSKQRFGLSAETRVVSCYEAGWDGFWLHRALTAAGGQRCQGGQMCQEPFFST